jgi:hypothetical protein
MGMTRWTTRLFSIERELWGDLPRLSITVEVPVEYKPRVDALLQKAYGNHNGHLTFSVELPTKPRTTGYKSQNHHLRGHEQQLAKELGLTMSEVHDTIKTELASWPERMVNGPHGEKWIKASEADISSAVCAEAIELCHMWAAHTGVQLIESVDEGRGV